MIKKKQRFFKQSVNILRVYLHYTYKHISCTAIIKLFRKKKLRRKNVNQIVKLLKKVM